MAGGVLARGADVDDGQLVEAGVRLGGGEGSGDCTGDFPLLFMGCPFGRVAIPAGVFVKECGLWNSRWRPRS